MTCFIFNAINVEGYLNFRSDSTNLIVIKGLPNLEQANIGDYKNKNLVYLCGSI